MRLDIAMEELLPASIERVWQALTDRHMISRWLMSTDFQARVGARFTLREEPRADCRGQVECQVLELLPPRRMVWSWHPRGSCADPAGHRARGPRAGHPAEPDNTPVTPMSAPSGAPPRGGPPSSNNWSRCSPPRAPR